jgi:hypothetical protein
MEGFVIAGVSRTRYIFDADHRDDIEYQCYRNEDLRT